MKLLKLIIISVACYTLIGCASTQGPAPEHDPFESYNRAVFEFNDGLDRYLVKPVAKGYDAITPEPAQRGISNFFSNLDDVLVIANDLLQLKFTQFASDMGRLLINSTLGLGGLIDWASDMGLEKNHEDFGQTLGYWGLEPGPYFVVPFLGVSTLRDFAGDAVDTSQFDPVWQELHEGYPTVRRDVSAAWSLTAGDVIVKRTSLLKAESILDEAALDRYTFVREAYLQRRNYLVHDGNPPQPEPVFNEEELFDFK